MDEVYEYVGEMYGNGGDLDPGTLPSWHQAFALVCQALGERYHGLITRDGGETYVDPESGETLLQRVREVRS